MIWFSSAASRESGRRPLRLRPLGAARLPRRLLPVASVLVLVWSPIGAPRAQESDVSGEGGVRHYEARWQRPPACDLTRRPIAGARVARPGARPARIWQASGEAPPCRLAPNAVTGPPYGFPLGVWVDAPAVPGRPRAAEVPPESR